MGFNDYRYYFCFLTIPGPMLRVFTKDAEVIRIGTHGFHIIGISFIPMVTSIIFPVFFQAVGSSVKKFNFNNC